MGSWVRCRYLRWLWCIEKRSPSDHHHNPCCRICPSNRPSFVRRVKRVSWSWRRFDLRGNQWPRKPSTIRIGLDLWWVWRNLPFANLASISSMNHRSNSWFTVLTNSIGDGNVRWSQVCVTIDFTGLSCEFESVHLLTKFEIGLHERARLLSWMIHNTSHLPYHQIGSCPRYRYEDRYQLRGCVVGSWRG